MAENSNEVGVLELQIRDKSAESAKGLDKLVDALTAIKHVVEGLDLSPVAMAVTKLHTSINKTKGAGTTVKSLGTLFNAIEKFTKLKSFNIPTKPFEDLKKAIGSGFNIGTAGTQLNAIRTALNGEWNTENATKMASSMKTIKAAVNELSKNSTAQKLADVTKQINAYNKATSAMQTSVADNTGTTETLPTLPGRARMNLQTFAEKRTNTGNVNGMKDTIRNITDISNAMKEIDPSSLNSLKEITGALKELSKLGDGAKLKDYASGLRSIANASDKGAKSYHTLTYLATAIGKIKTAIDGFTLPSFTKLENLARSLQENYNASENLKQIAEAMEALKSAGQGFTMPDVKGLSKVMAAMNGGSSGKKATVGTVVQETAESAKWGNEELETTVDAISSVNEVLDELTTNANPQLDFSQFDPANLPIGALGMQLRDAQEGVMQFGDAVRDSFESLRDTGALDSVKGATEGVKEETTAIILYSENLKNQWDSINRDMVASAQERNSLADEAIEKAKQLNAIYNEKYNRNVYRDPYPIAGNSDMFARSLRGDNGLAEQYAAMRAEASHTGETFEEVQQRIEKTMIPINRVRKQIDDLIAKLNEKPKINLAEGIDRMLNINGPVKSAEEAWSLLQNCMSETERQIDELITKLNTPININWQSAIDQIQGIKDEAKSAQESMSVFLEAMQNDESPLGQQLRELNPELNNLAQEMKETGTVVSSETLPKLVDLDGELKSKKKDAEEASKGMNRLKDSFSNLKKGISSMFPGLKNLGNQFKRLAIRMALRNAIKQITQGFSEGTENMYHYSQAIGGSFAKSMDSAAGSLLQMKNSIGAAVAPAIQAVIPVLQTVINWFIEGINWINQFFALLNGQKTWTKALPQTAKAFDDQKKAAKGASKAMKELLADWDELNIIQSQNAGTGGVSKDAVDYLNMFEEVNEFDSKIRKIVDFIQRHFDSILGIASAIGVAILGWKISHAFSGVLGNLGSYILDGAIIAVGLQLTYTGAYEAGYNGGFDAGSILSTVAGILGTAAGGAALGYKVGGVVGAAIGAVTGLVVGLAVAFKAYLDGQKQKELESHFGLLKLSDAEIAELVEQNVTSPLKVKMDVMSAGISNIETAKQKANRAIQDFGTNLQTAKFKLMVDDSAEGIKPAVEAATVAIDSIKEQLQAQGKGLEIQFTQFKYKNKEGDDISANLYSDVMGGNKIIQGFFTDLGNEMAGYIADGIQDGEVDILMSLMGTLQRVTNTAEANIAKGKFIRGRRTSVNNVYDRDTALKVYEEEGNALKEYQNTIKQQTETSIDSINEEVEYLKAIASEYRGQNKIAQAEEAEAKVLELTKEGGVLAQLQAQLDRYNAGDFSDSEEYKDVMNQLKELWIDQIANMPFGWDTYNAILSGRTPEANEDFQKIMDRYGITYEDLYQRNLTYNAQNNAGNILPLLEQLGIDVTGDEDLNERLQKLLQFSASSQALETLLSKIGKFETFDDLDKEWSRLNSILSPVKGANENLASVETFMMYIWDMLHPEENGLSGSRFNNPYLQSASFSGGIRQEYMGPRPTGTTYSGWDNGYASGGYTEEEQMTPEQMTNSVRTGVSEANVTQEDLLRQLVTLATRIAGREITVNVNPSSAWGNHMRQSQDMFERVSG